MKSENIRVTCTIVHPRQFSTFDEPTVPNPRAEAKSRSEAERKRRSSGNHPILDLQACKQAMERGYIDTPRLYVLLTQGTWWEQKSYAIWDHSHANARLQCWNIKFGIFLYSDCKSYSELVTVSVLTTVFEPYSSKNKSPYLLIYVNSESCVDFLYIM